MTAPMLTVEVPQVGPVPATSWAEPAADAEPSVQSEKLVILSESPATPVMTKAVVDEFAVKDEEKFPGAGPLPAKRAAKFCVARAVQDGVPLAY